MKTIRLIVTLISFLVIPMLSGCGESPEEVAQKKALGQEILDLQRQISETKHKINDIQHKKDSILALEAKLLDSLSAVNAGESATND
jgi:hypothetical protein